MKRFSEIKEAALSVEQRRVHDKILASRGSLSGPFKLWLYSPEFADRAQNLGEFLSRPYGAIRANPKRGVIHVA